MLLCQCAFNYFMFHVKQDKYINIKKETNE
jgi:hypothetical protein